MDFRVLGPLQVGDGAAASSLGVKQRRLLAALLVHANRVVTADRLLDVLWGDDPPATAWGTLQTHVSRLRSRLNALGVHGRLMTRSPGYVLEVPLEQVDSGAFDRLLAAARARVDRPDEAVGLIDEALALWRGPAYAEFRDDDFARAEALRLEEHRLEALEDRAGALLAAGRHVEVLGELEALVEQHPLRERLRSHLMRARYRSGRQAEALAAYRNYRRLLADELGLDPSPQLQQLERDILSQAPHLAAPPTAPAPTPSPGAPSASDDREARTPPDPTPASDDRAARTAPGETSGSHDRAARTAPGPTSGPVVGRPVTSPAASTVQRSVAGPAPSQVPSPGVERKIVTVLLACVADDDQAGELDPEDALERAQPALDLIIEAVHRFGGTVTRISGDGVSALFGAPRAEEDHAVRACYAALAMVDAARVSSAPIRVGCHSGEVLMRPVRTDVSQEYDAVGPAVERARLAQQAAVPGQVVASRETIRLAEGFVETVPLDGHLAGAPWWLVQRPVNRSGWEVRAARGLTPRVGREVELAILTRRLERAEAGQGQVVAIIGEPGIGKSRLVYEFTCSIPPGWEVATAAASPHDTVTPYRPLVPLVRSWLCPGDCRDGYDPDPAALRWLLGQPVDDPWWQALDAGIRRRQVLVSLTDLILRRAADRPQVLVVEDLHWIDGETQAVLDLLVDRIGAAPVLLLLTYRPEYVHAWSNRSSYTPLHLDPLAPIEAREMVAALLGDDPSVASLAEQLASWTAGSPLFCEETVRALTESGALTGEAGRYRLAAPLETLAIPTSVQAVLAARVDRLPAREKRALQAASVLGEEGPVALLLDVFGGPEDDARAALTALQAAEFLYERTRASEASFSFKHILIHAAVYASLPRGQREQLHARAAAGLRARYAGRLDDHLERLAHHVLGAAQWDEAAALLRVAGDRALDRSAYREAATFFEQALEALAHLPADPTTSRADIELRIRLRPALLSAGEFDRLIDHLEHAERLAERLGDDRLRVGIRIHLSYTLSSRGELRAASEAGRGALDLALELDEPELVAEARMTLAQAACFAGDAAAIIPLLEPDMAMRLGRLRHERLGMVGTRSVWALGYLASAHAALGRVERAAEAAEQAMRIADEVARPADLAFANLVAGWVLLERGDPEQATAPLRRAHEITVDADLRLVSSWASARLGLALALSGRGAEAREPLRQTLAASVRQSIPLTELWSRQALAVAALAEGDVEDAERQAARVLELARAAGNRLARAWALRTRAQAEASRESPDRARAEQLLREALSLAEALGAEPEAARCREALDALHAPADR